MTTTLLNTNITAPIKKAKKVKEPKKVKEIKKIEEPKKIEEAEEINVEEINVEVVRARSRVERPSMTSCRGKYNQTTVEPDLKIIRELIEGMITGARQNNNKVSIQDIQRTLKCFNALSVKTVKSLPKIKKEAAPGTGVNTVVYVSRELRKFLKLDQSHKYSKVDVIRHLVSYVKTNNLVCVGNATKWRANKEMVKSGLFKCNDVDECTWIGIGQLCKPERMCPIGKATEAQLKEHAALG